LQRGCRPMRIKLAYGKEGLWVDLPDERV